MKITLRSLPVLALISLLGLNPINAIASDYATTDQPAADGKMPNDEGKVISTIDTTGYTYMELENDGRVFWIAAPTTTVKEGDHIRFVQSMTMNNFQSKTLNRTFSSIIFVSKTMIKQ